MYTTEEELEMICQEYDSGGEIRIEEWFPLQHTEDEWCGYGSANAVAIHVASTVLTAQHPYHHHYLLVHYHRPQIPEQIQALGGENTGKEEEMEAGEKGKQGERE